MKVGKLKASVSRQAPSAAEPKKVGGLKESAAGVNTSRGARSCTKCTGMVREGNWVHTNGCPETVVQWKRYVPRGVAWPCPHRCTPVETPETITHHWTCPFWDEHEHATPF